MARIREVDGKVAIYLISPLYTSNAAIQPRLLEYRNQIIGLMNDSPDSNLHWNDGLSLGIDATNVGSLTRCWPGLFFSHGISEGGSSTRVSWGGRGSGDRCGLRRYCGSTLIFPGP